MLDVRRGWGYRRHMWMVQRCWMWGEHQWCRWSQQWGKRRWLLHNVVRVNGVGGSLVQLLLALVLHFIVQPNQWVLYYNASKIWQLRLAWAHWAPIMPHVFWDSIHNLHTRTVASRCTLKTGWAMHRESSNHTSCNTQPSSCFLEMAWQMWQSFGTPTPNMLTVIPSHAHNYAWWTISLRLYYWTHGEL